MNKSIFRLVVIGLISLLLLSGCNLPGMSTPTPLATFALPSGTFQPAETVPAVEQIAPMATGAPPTLVPTVAPPTQVSPSSLPTLTSLNLTYVDRIDGTTGWGWSDQYVGYTQDSGQTWANVTPGGGFPSNTYLSGAFLDALHGWVLTPGADYLSGTLYRTKDAGGTWQSATVPFSGASFDFLDATLGWAMVGTGAGAGSSSVDIYQTNDGGSSWSRIYSMDPTQPDAPGGLPFAGSKNGIGFASSTRGWVGGAEPMDSYVWLFVTQDGGRTWQHQDLALPAGFEKAMTSVDAPIFYNTLEGVIPVQLFLDDLLATVFYRTGDGGSSWQATRPVTLIGQYSVSSMNDFWVWDGKTLVASYDGGQTWQSIPANLNLADNLSQLDFVAPAQGWAIGMDANGISTLYQTVDGGYTWTLPGGEPLSAAIPSPTASSTPAVVPTNTASAAASSNPSKRSGPSVTAGYVKDAPVIDGILDEWTQTRYDVASITYGKDNWSGSKDLSGKVMLAWDEDNLYVAARVYDDVHVQNSSGEDLFKGDGIELLLDRNLSADFYDHALSSDDYQVGVSSGAPADMSYSDSQPVNPEAYLWYPKAAEGSLAKVKIGVFYTDDGYKIEVAIPWSVLSVTPKSGQNFGFAFSFSDNDNPDKDVQQTLMTNDPARRLTDPTTWGNLTLSK
jgi:photosystem II stability/assembly factor-like uncharacterized protein